jgi:hypothetical protein
MPGFLHDRAEAAARDIVISVIGISHTAADRSARVGLEGCTRPKKLGGLSLEMISTALTDSADAIGVAIADEAEFGTAGF